MTKREPSCEAGKPICRRTVLISGLALAAAAKASFPGGAYAQEASLETDSVRLGYIALTDAAPLIIAKEKGLFAKHGLRNAEVLKQASWGSTRDNLVLGSDSGGIDGAHILSPMPYLMSLGKITPNNVPLPMYLLARLNVDGQAISVANAHKTLGVGTSSAPLKEAFAQSRAAGREPKVAMTFPGGTHDLWMRYWLAAGGIDPDKDVSTIVVPPPQMVANMRVGTMDAFCVAEPWNAQLVSQNIGFTATTTAAIWPRHPEKALAIRADWIDKHPKAAEAVLKAVLEAQRWCDVPDNHEEMCRIMAARAWLNVPVADILPRQRGEYDYGIDGRQTRDDTGAMKFWRDHASFPFRSHDLWFLVENMRWGKLESTLDLAALIARVNRSDLWRSAAGAIGVASNEIPGSDSRGPERFFDGKVFDPGNPESYLAGLDIKRLS